MGGWGVGAAAGAQQDGPCHHPPTKLEHGRRAPTNHHTAHSALQAIFSSYGFHFPLTVAFLQMLFIAPVSYAIARPELSWQLARGLSPLALVNVLNVVAGLVGTQGLNVPMFIALRRFTLLITILLERFWLHKSHDWPTLAAMSIMIGGERGWGGEEGG